MKMKPIMAVMMLLMIIAIVFAYQGVAMHSKVNTEEASFHQLQNSYFSQSKAIRDSAATNSELNKDLVEIKNYPSELLKLKLVGVGKILTGIFVLLFAILMALVMMPKRLATVIKQK